MKDAAGERIRIGIVGAGANTRAKHIPGLRAIEGVEIVSVANRTRESGERAARELGIPKVYDNWLELVEADDTDAICIGTWPYLHCSVTLNALECNKHVLCEARMAMNANEAHMMLDAARQHPHLVTQVVPAPHTLAVDDAVCALVSDGYLGDVLAVEITVTNGQFVDKESPLHWRQDVDLSGYNVLAVGIGYETMMRWVGPAARVTAMAKVNVPLRRDAGGGPKAVTLPDHVDIIARLACGASAHLRFSAVMGLGPRHEAWLFGSEGTLRVDVSAHVGAQHAVPLLYGGRRGDDALKEMAVPPEKRGGWRVEEEFINAIRGVEKVRRTTFEDGVRYMEFTEAVIRSAQSGQSVTLPF